LRSVDYAANPFFGVSRVQDWGKQRKQSVK